MINREIAPTIRNIDKPLFIPPEKRTLDNGVPLFLLHAGTQEVCKIDFIFKAGTWQQEVQLQAAMCNAMLQEGSQQYSAAQTAEIMDFHGAYLQLMADQHYGTVSLISLTRHLPRLLPVVEDFLKNPLFPENEFETLVQRRKQRFLLENEKVKVLCQKKFSELLFGDGHPYAQTVKKEDFDSLQLQSLIDFHRHFYHAGNCEILVAGRFDEGLTELINRYFGGSDWKQEPAEPATFQPSNSPTKLLHVSKPDAIQSAIRVGKILVGKEHPDYLPLQILVTLLGGYFSSRLMANIREEKGYTYGIGASFFSLNEAGYLTIATEVDKSYEKATLNEIFHEIELLCQQPVSDDELERVRQYLLGEFIRDLDGPFALAQTFRNVHDFGLNYRFYDDYYQTLLHVSPSQLMRLAKTYFTADSFYTVIAGKN
ncbi:M16 family metallopeptidase [Gaoshiqia sediminis]|uniref:Insulinase family protein n=1 Tax=Gaoshiqia sediminis TaxID=2986998 RepID=A0AA41Y1Y4_9BACT|nr:pitrilysin family protein [Gaoshiqia sediminis]MCW0481979.1 insulinase family protein [Gaoshiqia sediminis]